MSDLFYLFSGKTPRPAGEGNLSVHGESAYEELKSLLILKD